VQPLLGAWRSRPQADRAAVIDVMLRLSQLACDLAEVAELDINPLLADAQGVLALDARVRLHCPGVQPAPLAIRPYPQELESTVEVDGLPLVLRPIRPEDGERLRDFYEQAPSMDLRLRFFQTRREVPRSELARYSQIDYDREMAFVALPPAGVDGEQPIVGEVRAVCDPDNVRAEFAIQVASDWQGRGLGRLLLSRLVDHLRSRGTRELVGDCLTENLAMARLARAAGFTVRPAHGLVSMRLDLAHSEKVSR
jgi:acetyltransferase